MLAHIREREHPYIDLQTFFTSAAGAFNDMQVEMLKISEVTMRRWADSLEYGLTEYKKGVYYDGHERADVIEARYVFLKRMSELEPLMAVYTMNDLKRVAPKLKQGQREHVLVVQDETTFNANDGRRRGWVSRSTGEGAVPPKKSKGKALHVSDFLSEAKGRLCLPPGQNAPGCQHRDARLIIKPGKNADGYWKGKDVLDQVRDRAIPIFNALHPRCVGVFVFDNSTAHGARAADALCVHNILKSDDGKELLVPMRDGWYVDADGTRVPQPMHFPTGKRKGLVTILTERALFDPKLKLNAVCGLCSTIPGLMREHQDGSSPCCLRSLLWQQLDFQEALRRSELAELITSLGHICIFLPKFHPELNFIEMYWGAVKRRTRNICDYSFPALQKNVPEQLDLVGNDLVFLRKLACKSWRYMDAYRKGLSGKPAEHAVKKYHSHRRVPQAAMQAFAV